MIKGIFLHDLPVYKDKNGIYCSTTMTDDLFSRYLHVVDELYVATRVYKIDKTYEEAHQEKITLANVKFIEFPNMNTVKGLFTVIPGIKKYLMKAMKNMDLIFIRGGTLARIGANIALKLQKPYLIEVGGFAWEASWNHSFKGKLIAPYYELSLRKYVKKADFAIYVTEKTLQKRYPTNGISTYASNVILTDIDYTALENRIEKIKNKKNKKIIIGTTGGINNKAKGQHFVFEVMKNLENKYDITYELVGGGDNSFLLQQAKKFGQENNITFKGELDHQEVLKWLDSIDIYIQPSMQEGLPRSVIEAMSRACPVIGSNSGGTPELLEEENVFERGNIQSLQSAFENIINSDWNKYAKRNFHKAEEYELSILNSRREKIYEQYRHFVIGGKN